MGPFSNAPIDTIKTRLQKTPAEPGETAISRVTKISRDMFKLEGPKAFYKGITPRVMRVAPGQAVTFTVYEFLKEKLEKTNIPIVGGEYSEVGELALPKGTSIDIDIMNIVINCQGFGCDDFANPIRTCS
jgi:hypothetical protein